MAFCLLSAEVDGLPDVPSGHAPRGQRSLQPQPPFTGYDFNGSFCVFVVFFLVSLFCYFVLVSPLYNYICKTDVIHIKEVGGNYLDADFFYSCIQGPVSLKPLMKKRFKQQLNISYIKS